MTILYWLAQEPFYALAATFVVALLVGSFLNVVIYRTPVMMEREWQLSVAEAINTEAENSEAVKSEDQTVFNLSQPRSRCPKCQQAIRWYENIPLISYFLILRGKCSGCKTPISLRYPLIELLTAVLSTWVVYEFGFNLYGLAGVFFTWCLISLTFIDADTQLLPDRITLPLLWAGLLVNSFDSFASLNSAIWGAALGYLSLWSVYWAFKLLTGKEGMGYGDFKLLAALGAWCGAMSLPLIILLSSVTGVIFALGFMLFNRHQAQNPLPFGPYLAIAGWIALIWGTDLTNAYLQLL